ncbi:18210_t:CDS:1, partial [Gigaspora margarita]
MRNPIKLLLLMLLVVSYLAQPVKQKLICGYCGNDHPLTSCAAKRCIESGMINELAFRINNDRNVYFGLKLVNLVIDCIRNNLPPVTLQALYNPPPIVLQAPHNRLPDPQQPPRRRRNAAEILADFQRQQQEFINQNRDEFINIDEDKNKDIE